VVVVGTHARRPVVVGIPASYSSGDERCKKHSHCPSEEGTERTEFRDRAVPFAQPRARGATSRALPSKPTILGGHVRLEELSSTFCEQVFIKLLVIGIGLIELPS
jgi:hypothetical protein